MATDWSGSKYIDPDNGQIKEIPPSASGPELAEYANVLSQIFGSSLLTAIQDLTDDLSALEQRVSDLENPDPENPEDLEDPENPDDPEEPEEPDPENP